MREIPVGKFITIGDEVYKCIELEGCLSCDFNDIDLCYQAICHPKERSDGMTTQFILYDNLSGSGEPFTSEDNASAK